MPANSSFASRYGPWALVTGASSGIGEEFARQLATRGLNVILVARRAERIEALAEELRSQSAVEAETLALDLAESNFLEPILSCCRDRDLGLLVSNAGAGLKGLHWENDPRALDRMLQLNCRAPMLLTHALAPRLVARGRGGIILTGSMEAYLGFPHSAAYAATKAFAKSLGEGIWGELRETGVDLLVLNPGATDTEILPLSGVRPEDMTGLMSPGAVARDGLERLGRGPLRVPGRLNRLLVGLLTHLPRRLAISLAGKGMRDALEKGKGPRPS